MNRKPKAPRGCFWRNGQLFARTRIGGRLIRWSLHTADPKEAAQRRAARMGELVEPYDVAVLKRKLARVRFSKEDRLFLEWAIDREATRRGVEKSTA